MIDDVDGPRGSISSAGAEKKTMRMEESTPSVDSFWRSTDGDTKQLIKTGLQSVEDCATAMRKKLSKSEQAAIGNASASELEDLIQAYMDRANDSKDARKGNVKSGKRSMSKFLDNFSEYVKAYSGVVQVMEGAGLGYGKAANGALQLFLVYAVNKEKTEDFIDKMLVELRQQYDRIQMLKDVFTTKRMKEYTAVLYRLGVEFLYETVRYYSMGTIRRLGHVIARPPSVGVERKVKEIKDAIRETEREMRALDSKKIDDLKKQQQKDMQTLGEVRKIVAAQQLRTDNDRLDILRRILHLDISDVATNVEQYEAMLNETFMIRRLPPLDVESSIFAHPKFEFWRAGTKSSLLLLHGATVAPDQTACSWLSPAAVRIVTHPNRVLGSGLKGSSVLTHYLYRPPATISADPKKVSPASIMSSIIHQVLGSECGKRILRDEDDYAFIRESLEALEQVSMRQVTERCQKLIKILGKLLVELGLGCLVVVIDRIDQVQGGLQKVVEILADLIETSTSTVKIFLTARSRAAFDDTDMKEQLGRRYARLTLNQDD